MRAQSVESKIFHNAGSADVANALGSRVITVLVRDPRGTHDVAGTDIEEAPSTILATVSRLRLPILVACPKDVGCLVRQDFAEVGRAPAPAPEEHHHKGTVFHRVGEIAVSEHRRRASRVVGNVPVTVNVV